MPLSIPITTLSHNLNKLWAVVETLHSAATNMTLLADTLHNSMLLVQGVRKINLKPHDAQFLNLLIKEFDRCCSSQYSLIHLQYRRL